MTPLPGSKQGQNIAVILVVLAVIVIAFLVLKKIGNFFGFFGDTVDGAAEWLNLKDTHEEAVIRDAIREAEEQASSVSSPWNPTYYKRSTTTLMRREVANKLAKQIWDSVGVFTDDSDAGVAAFKTLTNKAQVSWLCDVFNQNYQRDLFQWLKNKYDTDAQRANFKVIIDYVNSLKAY